NLHIQMDTAFRNRFIAEYQKDGSFKKIWNDETVNEGLWKPGQRFFKTEDGLLFTIFRDADFQPRLCVLEGLKWEIMTEAHEAPMESAH
ncbi:hypothetical protein C8R44DRAFT_544592, partial [Mycena epipterygia]